MKTWIRAACGITMSCWLSTAMLASAQPDTPRQTDTSTQTHEAPPRDAQPNDAKQPDAQTRDAARARAKQALEQSGAHQELPKDHALDDAPMHLREQAIPRKIDLEHLPRVGCNRDALPNTPGCSGCEGCAGPLNTGSSLSTVGQLLVALAAVLTLSLMAYLLSKVWTRRRYPTHRAAQTHTLLKEARALRPESIDEALAAHDYNRAIHALFLRTLLTLDEAGYALRPDWTPREIARYTDAPTRIKEPLSGLVHHAELARFRHTTLTRTDFERAARAAQAIWAAIGQEGS